MTELSCREHVPSKSRSNPARGSIGCVPVVIVSTVDVGMGYSQNTMQPIHLVDLRQPSLQELAKGVLQLIRSPTHLLMQQPFPRT